MKYLSILLCLFGMQVFAAKMEVAKVGVVFTDGGSFEGALVRLGPEADGTYLVKISGVDSDLNGKVIKVTSEGGGTGATYYKTESGGNLFRAPAHEYFGWEAYVGNKTYKINQDKKKTAALKTEAILADYLKQTKSK